MRTYSIQISSAGQLRRLVSIVNQYPCDVNLRNGLGCADCKSLFGVLGMGVSWNMELDVIGEEADVGALVQQLSGVFTMVLKERGVNDG